MSSSERSQPAALEVLDVTVRFGGVVALDDVSLSVAPGEIVGLIGPNGAGKSTLLDVVSGFTEPAAGRVRLDGVDVADTLAWRRARAGIGRSFQDARLYPSMTVREVLRGALDSAHVHGVISEALALPWARHEESAGWEAVESVLDVVDLRRYLDHPIGALSFGTTRAVELAWLAIRRPRLLLLDEPASGLQQSEVAVLGELIRRMQHGAAVVVVDHDVPFVSALSDRMVALDLGRVISTGTPDHVLADPTVLSSYLGVEV